MPYTHTTFLALKQALQDRLGDTVFWTDSATYSEVGAYLAEAMRVWQAAAYRWRDRHTFSTAVGTMWYDLTTLIAALNYTVTDRMILSEIQYHFLEPLNQTGWSGTDQYTAAEVVAAIQRRRNQFLFETASDLRRDLISVNPAPADGRFELPAQGGQPIIDVRRAAWRTGANVYSTLWRADEWEAGRFNANWPNAATNPPAAYSIISTQPLTVQFIPPPSAVGSVEIVGVYAGATLDISTGVVLGVPDNFAWVVKYGAMADLLGKEGQAADPARAAYCERRWQHGIELARLFSTVMFVRVAGVPVPTEAVQALDAFNAGWQNATAAQPTICALMDDFVAFPPPDAIYTITVDVVGPAPVPATNATQAQLGPEELDVILDYAQHVAAFKEGAYELQATADKYTNLIRAAAIYNEKLRAAALYKETIGDQGQLEDMRRPLRVERGRPEASPQ